MPEAIYPDKKKNHIPKITDIKSGKCDLIPKFTNSIGLSAFC